jgi:cyclic pyranopterin phosphate synthase
MNPLTHFNKAGEAHMINVGKKASTDRIAIADGKITMQPETLNLIIEGLNKLLLNVFIFNY